MQVDRLLQLWDIPHRKQCRLRLPSRIHCILTSTYIHTYVRIYVYINFYYVHKTHAYVIMCVNYGTARFKLHEHMCVQ